MAKYSQYVGVAAVVLAIIVVNVALILAGIVESTVTGIVTDSKTISTANPSGNSAAFPATAGTSFYGTKTENGTRSLPPKTSVSIGTNTCPSGAVVIGSDKRSIVCVNATTGAAINFAGTAAAISVTYLTADEDGPDSSSLGIFELAPFLYVVVFVILPLAGAVYGGIAGGRASVEALVAQFVLFIVGLILTTVLQDGLDAARVIFSYATEYNGVSAMLGLVLLLYIASLIVGLLGSARTGAARIRGAM